MRPGEWRRQLLSVDNWDYLLMVRATVKVLNFLLLHSILFYHFQPVRLETFFASLTRVSWLVAILN